MFVHKQEAIFGYGRGTVVMVNRIKDNNRKLIKKKIQREFLKEIQTFKESNGERDYEENYMEKIET